MSQAQACNKRALTKDEASNLLVRAKHHHHRNNRDKVPKRKYYCNVCEAWHLTSLSAKDFYKQKSKTVTMNTANWTQRELLYLKRNYLNSKTSICQFLDRPMWQVKAKLYELTVLKFNYPTPYNWKIDQIAHIHFFHKNRSPEQLAKETGATIRDVKVLLNRLNILPLYHSKKPEDREAKMEIEETEKRKRYTGGDKFFGDYHKKNNERPPAQYSNKGYLYLIEHYENL